MPSGPPTLEILSLADGEATARLVGDLDIVASDDVKRQLVALVDARHDTVVLDLSEAGFVDSSGLGVLVAVHRHAEARGGRFVVRSVPPHVQRLFEITRLSDLLSVDA